jgi:hypothetical protein
LTLVVGQPPAFTTPNSATIKASIATSLTSSPFRHHF